VSGIVYAATEGDSIALAGATVAIPGTSFSTTRGPDGSSSIEAPVGTTTILATAPGHWDDLQADVVPAGGGSGVELEVIPDPLVGQVAGGGGEVIFANVDVTTNVMPTVTNASDEDCSFEFPDAIYPSQAKVFTEVAMVCP
jgi:hypothetical protein